MTTTESSFNQRLLYLIGIYLFEMTTIENEQFNLFGASLGIYLLGMTTNENKAWEILLSLMGIYLLEMTTTENLKHYNKCF